MRKKKGAEPSPLMTASEVARLARVTLEAVKRWRESGKIPFVRTPGGKVRYLRSTVEAIFSEEVVAARKEPIAVATTKRQKARDARTDELLAASGQRG